MLRNRYVGRNAVAGGSVSDFKARLPQQLRAHTRFPLLPPVKAFSPQHLGATTPNSAKFPLSSPSNRDVLQPFSPPSLYVSSGNGTTAATTSHVSFDPIQRSEARRAKLSQLLEIRALYRNYIRAKTLLSMPFPVYSPSEAGKEATASGASGGNSEGADPQRLNFEQLEEFQEQERRKEAVDAVAEMLLAGEQIKVGLRTLPQGFGQVLVAPGSPAAAVEEAEALVRTRGKEFVQQLQKRVSEEMPLLPFGSEMAAQAALETQKARSVRSAQQRGDFEAMQLAINEGGSSAAGDAHEGSDGEGGSSNSSSSSSGSSNGLVLPGQDAALQLERGIEQLAQAEKVAGKFVATRLKPVLRKAQNAEVGDIVRGTGSYLKGLWQRLNGGGDRAQEPALSPDLPLPKSGSAKDTELIISQLSLELDDLAKRLREAGRTRENKLKQAKAPEGRVTMPFLLKSMDEEVLRLSRELALRTLQLEMEYAYRALEDEAMDIVGYDVNDVLNRQGSTAELRLLAAEFGYLDEQLAALASQVGSSGRAVGTNGLEGNGRGYSGAGAISSVGDSLVMEDLLASLANDVPDMRQRVGVPDQVVFGGQGWSMTKTRLQLQEALEAVLEAVTFMVRGLKLLTSDITNSGRRFWRAATGGTLKPREVSALKRTARDLLAFVPFTIILIIPISPLGHVLVFGFIQQYFPQFFPSCFTSKRQEIMVRYEELEKQLLAARQQAEAAEEEAELAQAAAAVARLTAPGTPAGAAAAPAAAAAAAAAAGGAPPAGAATATAASAAAMTETTSPQQGGNGAPGRHEGRAQESSAAGGQGSSTGPSRSRTGDDGQHGRNGTNGASALAGNNGQSASPQASTQDRSSEDTGENEEAAQAAQVRVQALEEQVAAVFDDVTLGDMDPQDAPAAKKERSSSIPSKQMRKGGS